MLLRLLPVALALLLATVACTQERLQPPKKEVRAAVDNLVAVDAKFCTAKPEDVIFPVKILLILDASGSLQFLDEGGLRVAAVRQLLQRFDGDPSVSFNVIQFNSLLYQVPPDGTFANPVDVTDTQLQLAEVLTDYQAALSLAYGTLLQDMTRSGALVQNTKYVVIFFSDGQPSPVCCPCDEETAGFNSTATFNCDPITGQPDPPPPVVQVGTMAFEQRFCENALEIPLCNIPRDQLNMTGRAAAAYTDLNTNGSYNRKYQIEQLVRDIVDLGTTFEVGQFQMHAVFLENPTLPAGIRNLLALDAVAGAERLQSMAALGGGNFIRAQRPEELDFLQFDYTAIKRAFGLRRVLAINLNAAPGAAGPLVDSDGDGVSDDEEERLGTNFLRSDTDGDGYRDLLEIRQADRGMDALDPAVPFDPCGQAARTDVDHDLLNDCEERFLGTNPQLPDSDFDTLPDGVEVRFGLDPNVPDADLDYDFDGFTNGVEVNNHTDPRLDDRLARERASYRYNMQDDGETLDRRSCFNLRARNIQLMYTQGRDGTTQPGWNDIWLYEMESPQDNGTQDTRLRVACFRARYLPPDYKDPVKGSYTPLEDFELKDVFDPEAMQKCWGPPMTVTP
ncbi:MAG: VWA domain-containing protein [Deltaproteobacteria bacterium]|nr:VWA domain-containing protein [Deltaproteobacteria bacterium]